MSHTPSSSTQHLNVSEEITLPITRPYRPRARPRRTHEPLDVVVAALCTIEDEVAVLDRPKTERAQLVAELDGISLDECKAFTQRMSRWKREATEAVLDRDFWRVLRITRVCHEPLDHVLAWLQVVSTADTLDDGTRIGKLVCGHAMIFAAELDAVLDFEWTSVLNLGMSRASASDASEAEIFTLVVQLSTSHSSGFFGDFCCLYQSGCLRRVGWCVAHSLVLSLLSVNSWFW